MEMNLLEYCVRQDLEATAPRGMAVLDPLKVTLTNFTEDDMLVSGPWHGKREDMGSRDIPFGRELYIERSDFALEPPKKWKRLSPNALVRLRYGFIIRCDEVISDAQGRITELRCSYFPDSRSGSDTSGLKPNGVIHWVSADKGEQVEVRDYDRLFRVPDPTAATFLDDINPDSLTVHHAVVEPAILTHASPRFQFERIGYFCRDEKLPRTFNKTVSLREGF